MKEATNVQSKSTEPKLFPNEVLVVASATTQNHEASASLSAEDRAEITTLMREAINSLGSASALATKCDVSNATISLILENKYTTKGDEMWRKIAAAIGWRRKGWVVVNTNNTMTITNALTAAKERSMFMAISEKAGSGKSTAINLFIQNDRTNSVFRLLCRKWTPKQFLTRLRTALGIQELKGYHTLDDILQQVIDFLLLKKGRPLLILDQANSLHKSVFPYIIDLYNDLEERCGCIMSGTESLNKEIKRGVQYQQNHIDEIDSRFGRNFITLPGFTKGDVKKIALANGIEQSLIETIWNESTPRSRTLPDGAQVTVVDDGRRIKRVIEKYLILNQQNQPS